MFLAVGTHNYVGAVFHMVTHASFKALLFLGSGSVIHAMAHEQDMRRYGNLRKYLPITFGTFMVGWLAICGVPPLSGFFSKDEILAGAFNAEVVGNLGLWAVGMLVAVLTAFYMTRQVIMTFFGEERWREADDHAGDHADDHADDHDHHHLTPDHTPHESPITMTLPLMVLAGAAALAGLLNMPFAGRVQFLEHWLEPSIVGQHELPPGGTEALLSLAAVLAAVAGILIARRVYLQRKVDAAKIEKAAFAHAWYIDETYAKVAGGPGMVAFQGVADFDSTVVDGAVNGVGAGAKGLGERLRGLQNGLVRSYALGIAVAAALLLAFVVTRING
jgi:NADH:ubiquinone oxidoreductase subunit 5 (subunit L)/multisubunit Na+/H+ antiporter MnhA subunit